MATRFQIWLDSPTDSNSLSYSALSSDSQRASGFVPGTAASSARVNSMLRQNSLAIVALMDTICPSSSIDLRSAVSAVKTEFINYFGQFFVTSRYIDDTTTIEMTLKNGNVVTIDLSPILNKTIARATADGAGNNIVSTYATKAELTNAISNAIGTILETEF